MDTDFIGPLESLQDKERGHSAFVHANKIQNRDILLFFIPIPVFVASVLLASCSPVYSIGVHGDLSQPMNVDCILNAAQTTEGVQQVLVHQIEPRKGGGLVQATEDKIDPPTAYLVTAIDQNAQIEQSVLNNGQITFWVGRHGVGVMPSLHTIDMEQAFHVRLASHIAEVCKASYSGNAGMTCVPDSEACHKLLANPRSK